VSSRFSIVWTDTARTDLLAIIDHLLRHTRDRRSITP